MQFFSLKKPYQSAIDKFKAIMGALTSPLEKVLDLNEVKIAIKEDIR